MTKTHEEAPPNLSSRPRSARKQIIFLLCLIGLLFLPLTATSEINRGVSDPLNSEERAWLNAHPRLRLAPDPEFKPIEFFNDKGIYDGIGADFLRLISQKLRVEFEIVRYAHWDDVIEGIKKREIDILNAVVKSPQRERYLLFPKPYLYIPSVIIVRKSVSTDLKLNQLEGMHVVMVSNYGYLDLIRNQYPDIGIETVPDLKTALRKVSFGMADAFVGDLATASHYIESEGITNLKLAGECDPQNISGFAVRSDWPMLSQILEKGVALLSEEEKKMIFSNWIHLEKSPGMTAKEIRRKLLPAAGIILLVILAFLVWNHLLKRTVNRKTMALSREIGERRKTEAALKESETHLRTLLKTIPDLVWLKDPNGTYLACNARFERFFGAREKEIVGRTDYDFLPAELADFFREHDMAAVAKGGPNSNEEKVHFADDGHQEILETIKTPIYGSDGQLVGVLGIARDITDRKQAEEDRKRMEDQLRHAHKMEAIGTLAGGIAHDFNNILAAIIGYADMALDHIPAENPAHSHIDKVLRAGNRAKELVRHILHFSRKEALKPIPIAPHRIIGDVLDLLRASIPSSIVIEHQIDDNCGSILAEPTQIHQVLMNLCTNAAQSMEESGGIMRVELASVYLDDHEISDEPHCLPGEYISLSVTDSGKGIEPGNLHRIFDPYFTTREVGKGSGMGLAVVLGIVKSHMGMIKVNSKPGRGTTITVFFPKTEDPTSHDEGNETNLPRGSEHILVVDDEDSIVEIIRNRLEGLGYRVTATNRSTEALEWFRSDPEAFDALITDQTMPELSGEELSRSILTIRPGFPIIICTGFSSRMDKNTASRIGIREFILKPVERAVLALAIRKVLDAYPSSSETNNSIQMEDK